MPRVLHLLTALGHGGAETWLLNVVAPLRELGVETGFVLKAPQLGALRDEGVRRGARVYDVPLTPSHAGYVRGIARIARSEAYDVVHTHEFVFSGAGVLAARLAAKPTVMTLHNYSFEPETPLTRRFGVRHARELYGRASLRYALARADAITAFTRGVMGRVVSDYASDPRCRFIRLSVDAAELTPDGRRALRESIGVPHDAPLVVHVGRFIEQKNHAGVLRVFRRVLVGRPDARLILMGQGPLKDDVLASARDLLDAGRVRFLGLRNDVPALLAASDVMLFPSAWEGFGLVALEANGAGVPVVGSRVPGLDEAVVDGETALLHALDDETGMAASVLALIEDPALRARIGAAGRRRALEEFSHRRSAELLRDVYASVAR